MRLCALVRAASAGPAPKAFPPGCWKGTGVFQGTYNKGTLQAKVTNGKLKFGLVAGKGAQPVVLGAMDTGGHGSGSLTTGGTKIAMEVEMVGDYTIYGTPAKPKVKGQQRWTGTAVYHGTKIPVDFKLPAHAVPMTITTVSASKVTGAWKVEVERHTDQEARPHRAGVPDRRRRLI